MQLACVLTSSAIVDWLAIGTAVAVSTLLITKSVLPRIEAEMPNVARLAAGGILGAQILFGFMLKMHFFRRISYY